MILQLLLTVNMRSRHPNKEIEDALRELEAAGWRVEMASRAHRWGVVRCPEHSREGHQHSVYSTPRSPSAHARLLRKYGQRCEHGD